MAFVSVRSGRFFRSLIPILLLTMALPGAAMAMVRALEGQGNFHTYVEVINRWVDEDRLDVMVLVQVANGDLRYEEEKSGLVGRMLVEVQIKSLDGQVRERKRTFRTTGLDDVAAASMSLHQVFGVLLEDVPFTAGQIACRVTDTNRRREGIINSMARRNARSECASDWVAETSPRPGSGIALEDPLFLMRAPFDVWNPDETRESVTQDGFLHDYMNPSRRYGLEQDHLQIFQPVWPKAGGVSVDDRTAGLRIQVTSLDLDFALTDTVVFDHRGRMAMEAGRPAALFYELDVNLLPEGSYLLSMAPLDATGRGVITQFDVVWRLSALSRHRSQLLGEGRTVLLGADLKKFEASSAAEQENMLEEFWFALNPDPEDPVNTVYIEFQRRLAYVRKFLGGFDQDGAVDDRGEVFLLLGPPDEVQSEVAPANYRDQDDARIKVFERFAPDREGTQAKGAAVSGTGNINPYDAVGGIPMPYSTRAETQRQTTSQSATHHLPYELWKYNNEGNPLFLNRFSNRGMGQRFLFVDNTGVGEYVLESSNVVQGEE